jgi:hypothetical protein
LVRLGHWKYCRYDFFGFRFYSSFFVCLTRMRSIQNTATIALDRYDILYDGEKKTPAAASIFQSIWISLLHNFVKRVRNRTARFRCVFGSTDGYGV